MPLYTIKLLLLFFFLDSPESGISSLNSTPNKLRSKDTYSPIYDEHPAKIRRFLSPTMVASRELSPRDEFRYHYPVLPSYSAPDGYQPQNSSGPGLPMVLPGSISSYTSNTQNTPEYNTTAFSEHFGLPGKKSPFNTEHLAPGNGGGGNTSAWQNFSAYGASSSSNENSPYGLNTYPMTSLSANYGRVGGNVCKHGLHHCSVCVYEASIPPLNSI